MFPQTFVKLQVQTTVTVYANLANKVYFNK